MEVNCGVKYILDVCIRRSNLTNYKSQNLCLSFLRHQQKKNPLMHHNACPSWFQTCVHKVIIVLYLHSLMNDYRWAHSRLCKHLFSQESSFLHFFTHLIPLLAKTSLVLPSSFRFLFLYLIYLTSPINWFRLSRTRIRAASFQPPAPPVLSEGFAFVYCNGNHIFFLLFFCLSISLQSYNDRPTHFQSN